MGELLLPTGSTGVPLELHVSRLGSGGVGSLTPVVQIRNATTGDSYLDFADNTFKTSGWTTKQSSLTAITGETGRYRFLWNSSIVAAIVDGFRAVAEYIVTGGSAFIASDTVIFRTEAAGGGGPSAADIADAVWDESLAAHQTAGSTGEALDASSSGGDPSAIADAVWDEAIAGHLSAGSTGETLSDAGAAGNPWSTPISGNTDPGTFGQKVGNLLGPGSGATTVTTDTGGVDNLRYLTSGAVAIDNADVKFFLKTDYDAGNRNDTFLKAFTTTKIDGRLASNVFLDTGFTYTAQFQKQGLFGPDTKEFTI